VLNRSGKVNEMNGKRKREKPKNRMMASEGEECNGKEGERRET
jgi:hypothetical protein